MYNSYMEKKIIQNSRPNDLVNNSLAINVHDKKYYEEEIELTSLEQKRMEKFMKDFTEIHGDNKHLFREKIKCIVEETDEKAHISYRLGNMIL